MLALIPAAPGDPQDLLARTLVFVVLAAGGLAALALLLRRGPRLGGGSPPLAGALAGTAFAGVVGGLLAAAIGGPGALLWLALAGLAGAALQAAEVRLPDLSSRSEATGPAGQVLSVSHALAATLAALAAGALLHAQQAAEVARAASSTAPWAIGLALAALTTAAALRGPGRWLGPAALVALAVHLALMLVLLAGDRAALSAVLGDMSEQAFGGAAAAGGLLAAAAQGVLRAAVAGATGGLGHAAALGPRGAWAAPLVAAAVALVTGLAALGGQTVAAPAAGRELLPLERSLRAGLAPSEYGQLVVLPADAGLAEGQRYPVVLRADPRGHRYGDVFREENIVAAPGWAFTRAVDTVVLRDKDPERGKNPGFDLRIPVTRELVETRVGPFIKLHPVDPTLNIRQLMTARDLDGPFLAIADHCFEAGVLRGYQLDSGERLSLFAEPRPQAKDDPPVPALRDLITLDYAGPYPDTGTPAPPLALAAPLAGGLVPGTVAHLRLETPTRGLELGFVNRLGELEVPPWEFLAAADTAVLRHRDDPALDRKIRVRSRIAFGRLRFWSEEIDLDRLGELLPEHSGPHLLPPDYRFAVEVHHGARLPADHAETSLALIPVHMHRAPTGNSNPGLGLYDPHPGEVLLTGMAGPFLDEDRAAALVRALAHGHGRTVAGLEAAALVVLALAGLLQWLRAGLSAATRLLGTAAGAGFGLVFALCVAVGPGLGLAPVLRVTDVTVAAAVLLATTRLLVGLPRLVRGARPPGP